MCAMDSREVKVYGLIKDLHVILVILKYVSLNMDVVTIEVLDSLGML
jgi:hypothetical protein